MEMSMCSLGRGFQRQTRRKLSIALGVAHALGLSVSPSACLRATAQPLALLLNFASAANQVSVSVWAHGDGNCAKMHGTLCAIAATGTRSADGVQA